MTYIPTPEDVRGLLTLIPSFVGSAAGALALYRKLVKKPVDRVGISRRIDEIFTLPQPSSAKLELTELIYALYGVDLGFYQIQSVYVHQNPKMAFEAVKASGGIIDIGESGIALRDGKTHIKDWGYWLMVAIMIISGLGFISIGLAFMVTPPSVKIFIAYSLMMTLNGLYLATSLSEIARLYQLDKVMSAKYFLMEGRRGRVEGETPVVAPPFPHPR